MLCEETSLAFDSSHELDLVEVPPIDDRRLLEARDVAFDAVDRELVHLIERCFEWLNTNIPAIGHDQAQAHDVVVKMAKLLPGDHDLLFVRVALAADVELLGYLWFPI